MSGKKESTAVIVARIDERTKIMKDQNDKEHKEIKEVVIELANHVNHEVAELKKERKADILRVESLEKGRIADENKYKGRMELFKWTSTVLGITLAILSVITFLGTALGWF